ncbi:hypothetical protein ABG768_015799, partial [Culter alburnus]
MKPTNPNAAPRSVVVKFLHFQTKQRILHKAWATKDLQFNGSRVALDHDYSNAVQRKRREYKDIKKQLKERKIKFKSPYPAILKVQLEDGEVSYSSAWEAAEGLQHLGIRAKLSEAEMRERDLFKLGLLPRKREETHLSTTLVGDIESLS